MTDEHESPDERHIRLTNEARVASGLPAFSRAQAERFLKSVHAFRNSRR